MSDETEDVGNLAPELDRPIRVCAVETKLDARDTRWQKTTITWALTAGLPSLTMAAVESCARDAFASWSAVAGLTFVNAPSAGSADIILDVGSIDGPRGTLAWSELPPSQPCHQRYDSGENWSADAQGQSGPIDLVAVMTHEIGHALGLQHDEQNSGSLMAPYYSPTIRVPQTNDTKRIQALYGPAKPSAPIPPTQPSPGGGSVIVIEIVNAESIRIPGYLVTRVK